MKLLGVTLAIVVIAGAAGAQEDISGQITAIDPSKGTFEISTVTIEAKDASIKSLLMPTTLARLKIGDKVEAQGEFSGRRRFAAKMVEKKLFDHYEINAKLGRVDAKARTLEISGVTIKVPASCEIQDPERKTTTIEKLPVGRMTEVEGNWTGDAEFTAYKIEVYKEEEKVEEREKD